MLIDSPTRLLSTVDRADPGDETFRRFRYQATYAAILAVELLEEGGDVVEIYCEQYEDILLRLTSGMFRGIQIKTKDDGAEPLQATDEPILESLLRFVELELSFPGLFKGFTLATNVAFNKTGKGHGNLYSVIAEAQAHADDAAAVCSKASRLAKTLIKRLESKVSSAKKATEKRGKKNVAVAATVAGDAFEPVFVPNSATPKLMPTEADILRVFAKLDVLDDLPKLPDIRSRMRERLVRLSTKVANSTFHALEPVMEALEYAAYLAASRGDEDRNGRHWFISDPEKRAKLTMSDEIQAKCLSRSLVEAAINKHCAGALLVSAEPAAPEQIPADLSILEKKLIAGGLSNATLSLARDAIASVEEFGAGMLHVHGHVEGLRRYKHARAVVKKECALAYESQSANGSVNGSRMLADVEARLKERRTQDTSGVLKECEEEHLLGHAFDLTRECVVWWSVSRDLVHALGVSTGGTGDE